MKIKTLAAVVGTLSLSALAVGCASNKASEGAATTATTTTTTDPATGAATTTTTTPATSTEQPAQASCGAAGCSGHQH